ncbi:unnamed protein product [Rotaria sp. Silwood2]|nr:unnamed protein product [Rotaria sp. Silwood2]CAF2907564.1 unnamed protein product [Rotaria sp. Silwood2]CAF3302600.1 unnamed protein product [Rotaria sp. Silwood2]
MPSEENNVRGYISPGWECVRSVFEQNFNEGLDIGASLCVYHRGKCVVDLSGGWKDAKTKKEPYTDDTLQLTFSTAKGIMAAAVALCVERGWLDYDAPVTKYWPQFGQNGKENILLSDLLSHRSGLPYIDQQLTVEDVCNWSRMISLLIAEKPHWDPGSTHGYHGHTIGFLVGELIRCVDPQHRSYGQFVREELDDQCYIGVSDDIIEARVAPLIRKQANNKNSDVVNSLDPLSEKTLTCSGAFPLGPYQNSSGIIYNEAQIHQAELPAVNAITNARSVARIYARLMGDIYENGKNIERLLSEKTLSQAIENITPVGETDRIVPTIKTAFGKGGFQVYGEIFNVFGDKVFGHNGKIFRF